MELQYTITGREARIDKIEEVGAVVSVPEELEGCPVTELGAYVLSGSEVEEVHLPPHLKKIGAYGFYECDKLRRIYCYSRVTDLGAGLFAGVRSVELLDITEFEGEKSCFQDMLSELRQTLRVRLRPAESGAGRDMHWTEDGAGRAGDLAEARLIFPEYFEESVENTPARILFIETHGCGHRYRYCFANRQFQYLSYDELFPHAKVQEPEELVTELALGRLLFSAGLSEAHRVMYLDYVREHWQTAGRLLIGADGWNRGAVTNLEPGGLPWLVESVLSPEKTLGMQLETLISMAQQAGDTEMVSWLMDYRHRMQTGAACTGTGEEGLPGQQRRRKKRFEL